MVLSILFGALLLYMLYRLVFGFIIPIVRTTRRMKRSFRDMQDRMQSAGYGQQQPAGYRNAPTQPDAKSSDEDYIEFEEVK